jgi:hypothetical protein
VNTQANYTQDLIIADMLVDRFNQLAFCFGANVADSCFASIAYGQTVETRRFDVSEKGVEALYGFYDKVVADCMAQDVNVSGIGIMFPGDKSYGCYCYDNFMNKRPVVYVPVDNEGECDIHNVNVLAEQVDEIYQTVLLGIEYFADHNVFPVAG